MVKHDLITRFTYHPLQEGQPDLYQKLRDCARNFAFLIEECCPDSREKSLAITKLEEVVMWANASIARSGAAGAGAPVRGSNEARSD